MVNYCYVEGCGRNSKTNKHLFYYGLPKDMPRLREWLCAIGREDLLEKNPKSLSYRVCSRHFSPASIKNKHLCADAVPTLYLPSNDLEEEDDEESVTHNDVVCNSCNNIIHGFRYKCVTCSDYDLCSKCEMFEAHSKHFLLRIPKPVRYKEAADFIKKWQQLAKTKKNTTKLEVSSDDDMPITEYVKQYDKGLDLSEEVKSKIRDEVTRVLSIRHCVAGKRKKKTNCKESSKKKKVETQDQNSATALMPDLSRELVFVDVDTKKEVHTDNKSGNAEILKNLIPEVLFDDVDNIADRQPVLVVKDEIPILDAHPHEIPVVEQPITDLNLSEVDFMLTPLTEAFKEE